ncbi:MAG: hypothetical protein WC860_08025 [Candidatus Margulisiibacteriota bacterium]|jgi:hypothetical protein
MSRSNEFQEMEEKQLNLNTYSEEEIKQFFPKLHALYSKSNLSRGEYQKRIRKLIFFNYLRVLPTVILLLGLIIYFFWFKR